MKILLVFFILILVSIISINDVFSQSNEVIIISPPGSSLPGCQEIIEGCFTPNRVIVDVGEKVIFSNNDTSAHTFTAGDIDGPSGAFDSGLVSAGSSFEWIPTTAGEFPFYCTVHPWMFGSITVKEVNQSTFAISTFLDKHVLKLKSGSFTLEGFQIGSIIGNNTSTEINNFFFIQTTHYLNSTEIQVLKDKGITLIDYYDAFVYVASANNDDLKDFKYKLHPEIRSITRIEPQTKIDSSIKSGDVPPWILAKFKNFDEPLSKHGSIFTIYFHQKFPSNEMSTIVTNGNSNVRILSSIESFSTVTAYMSFNQMTKIAEHNAVKYITFQDPPLEPEIFEAKIASNIPQEDDEYDYLTGHNVVALVFDDAAVNGHVDLINRLTQTQSTPPIWDANRVHGTHVAGILGGDGTVDATKKGVAPGVEILSYGSLYNSVDADLWFDVSGDLDGAVEKANDTLDDFVDPEKKDRIDLMNISMGQNVNKNGWDCKDHGNYTETSRILDRFVNGDSGYPKIIITKSAGNEGILGQCLGITDYPDGFGTIASPATAKNPIVVGSIDTETKLISSFSSWGPTDDGRIKPDLVAPGSHNSAGYPDTDRGISSTSTMDDLRQYETKSGTSMAAPLVGGIVALMEEELERDKGLQLFPHTAKAILIHTADDLGRHGPDYKYGWGLVNGTKAIELIDESTFVNSGTVGIIREGHTIIHDSFTSSGQVKSYTIELNRNNNLKLTLVWDDKEGFSGIDGSLRNKLDLWINAEPPIFPYLLNEANPDAEAMTGKDEKNNVEMIETSQSETLQVKVSSVLIPPFSQDFTLIVSAIPNVSGSTPTPTPTPGCLIATAAFGTELAPQVQFLREIRDNTVMSTALGASFMTGFNQVYYSFSPTIADWERENSSFKEMVKIGITPMISTLSIISLADSEQELVGYGIGVVLLNIGMYLILPIFVIIRVKRFFKK